MQFSSTPAVYRVGWGLSLASRLCSKPLATPNGAPYGAVQCGPKTAYFSSFHSCVSGAQSSGASIAGAATSKRGPCRSAAVGEAAEEVKALEVRSTSSPKRPTHRSIGRAVQCKVSRRIMRNNPVPLYRTPVVPFVMKCVPFPMVPVLARVKCSNRIKLVLP